MKRKKILITGCGGMLGKAAYEILSKKFDVVATDIDLNEEWLKYLDVREISDFETHFINNDFKFDIIFHFAALTDLEFCEENHENSWKTNALGTENAALIAKKYNCELVYISTAGIFDTPNCEVFNDFDDPSPKSIYGRSKYYGEKIVQSLVSEHYVFRAGWMMGSGDKDKKFVKKILNQIKNGASELNVVDDKLGTPTYTYDFINNMLGVINKKQYGLYNQVCKGDCSRYDVAVEMIKLLNVDIKINLVKSSFFEKEYYAPRPYSEKLINLKLQSRGLNNMRHWKECLNEYMKNYGIDFINKI
jgi:dTDP-4-dehydrorhamnose reductase